MNKVWLLLRAQILNTFSLNEMMEPGSHKRNSSAAMAAGVFILVLFLCAYNVFTALQLVHIQEQELIPAYMVAVSSFAVLFLTMFRSNGILFGSKDFEMLSSLPVKTNDIVSSKFLFMYLINFIVVFVFMAPGGVVWIMNTTPDLPKFVLYTLSMFFVPLIPMCVAAMIGVFIVLAAARFKYQNVFSLIFSFAALGLVGFFGVTSLQSGSDVGSLSTVLAEQMTRIYPLSQWFMATSNVSILISMSGFLALSALVFVLLINIVAAKYGWFHSLASAASVHSPVRKSALKQRSKFSALYQKELGRFFSSYVTVLNTGLGVAVLFVLSVALLFISPEKLSLYAGIENMDTILPLYAPVLISSLLSLSCPAASSISLEGKNIWILQSSPVSVKTILNSKLAVNITLHLFGYTFAVLSLIIRFEFGIAQTLSLLFIPVVYSLFTSVLGVFLNKKHPNYHWQSEVVVVKQSLPVIVSSIISLLAVAAPVGLHLFLRFPFMPTLAVFAVVLIVISFVLYQKACRTMLI
ncbi:hypothetical protein G4V62_16500 [Bacillaceae bacterium SIJ1]|uniref:hypothetical protein n=1 Tax=Litoribacterium kuwaitense TaxID=1398745 RepID=UPI0013EB9E62|nr:hypothetical protein [Litoribacterium kuwaitense]NGP46471.1 hypothetical protein [Litoribacterium kuwaitense]